MIFVQISSLDSLMTTVLGNRQFIIFLATVLVTLPLSMYRNIARLSKVRKLVLFILEIDIIEKKNYNII